MNDKMIEWTECDMTLAEFHRTKWAIGILYEAREQRFQSARGQLQRIDDVTVQYLIGDVNDSGGLCDCCSIRADSDETTRVIRFTQLI